MALTKVGSAMENTSVADFNSTCKVNVTLACVCSQCRLCKQRNKAVKGNVSPLVEVETFCPGSSAKRSYYCSECYEYLLARMEDQKLLPALIKIKDSAQESEVPLYLVKQDDPLRLYYPTDEIDLGLWKKKREQQNRKP
jgi:hypothetical protein